VSLQLQVKLAQVSNTDASYCPTKFTPPKIEIIEQKTTSKIHNSQLCKAELRSGFLLRV
jgi:hypothetical protein